MSLMNDIIDRAARKFTIRERLGVVRGTVGDGNGSSGLMELAALVEEYFAARDYANSIVGRSVDRLLASEARLEAAKDALRAVVAP